MGWKIRILNRRYRRLPLRQSDCVGRESRVFVTWHMYFDERKNPI
jgi:hypothetical protein